MFMSFPYAMIMHYKNYNIRNPPDSLVTYLMHMKVVDSIAALLPAFKHAYPDVHDMVLKWHASYLIVLVGSLLARDCSIVIVVSRRLPFQCFLLVCSRRYSQ